MGWLTFSADILLEVLDLGQGRVLAASAQKVAEAVNSDTTVATLVEEGEGLLVVGGSLRFVIVRRHCDEWGPDKADDRCPE